MCYSHSGCCSHHCCHHGYWWNHPVWMVQQPVTVLAVPPPVQHLEIKAERVTIQTSKPQLAKKRSKRW